MSAQVSNGFAKPETLAAPSLQPSSGRLSFIQS